MMLRARRVLHDVHRLACVYHWGEREILEMPIERRLAYLRIISMEEDARLFPGLELEQ